MVRSLLGVVIALSMPAHLAAQGGQDTSVIALENEWNAARLRGDTAALDRLLDSAWTMVHVDGRLEDRKSYIAGIGSHARQIQAIVPEEQLVKIRGNTAIVSGIVRQRGLRRGAVREGRLRFTHVWIRDGGRWRMMLSHSTELHPSTAP